MRKDRNGLYRETFSRDFLESLGLPHDADDIIVHHEAGKPMRWYTPHHIVFELHGQYWQIQYFVGNTEKQEIDPWNDAKEITGILMRPEQIMVTKRLPVRDGS